MNTYRSPSPHAPTIAFLIELRYRFLIYCAVVGTVLIVFLFFSGPLYALLTKPIAAYLGGHAAWEGMHYSTIYFIASFKLALIPSLLVTAPVLLYQLWAFTFPRLQQIHTSHRLVYLVAVTLLFYFGLGLTYFTLFPALLALFKQQVLMHLPISLGLISYLGFVLKLFFIFGLGFQIPAFMVMLVLSGRLRLHKLKIFRPYMIMIAFIVSLFILPFDVISQTLFVLPLWILFELGLLLARLFATTMVLRSDSLGKKSAF